MRGYNHHAFLITAISGRCIGGAGLLVLLADLAIASEDARSAFPEPKPGVFGGVMMDSEYRAEGTRAFS